VDDPGRYVKRRAKHQKPHPLMQVGSLLVRVRRALVGALVES
jgi:hypothetical protein